MIKLLHGDCLELVEGIPDGSVDLILTDPPYGTVKNAPKNWTVGNKASHGWDKAINPEDVFGVANRILRRNGKLVLFSQEPYTSRLITEAHPNIPFSYRMIWEKNDFANALLVNKAPVSYYEDILVFSKTHENHNTHPMAEYVKELQESSGNYWNGSIAEYYVKEGHSKTLTNAKAMLMHYLNWEYVQFSAVTKRHYDILSYFWEWGMTYKEITEVSESFKRRTPSIFNLWEGNKYKPNILRYKKDYDGYHPTQKPVALLEDLIKTFSNEGDTVVDLTMGSGSTGVACKNTNRKFIGIELDEEYYNIATNRIKNNKVADN